MQFNANGFSNLESVARVFSVNDGGIIDELHHFRFSVVDIRIMFMDGAAVPMSLHSMFQCRSCETNIVDFATLASVVRALEMIYYISLLAMLFPRCGAIPHEE